MPALGPKTQSLTIYLLKEGFKTFEAALKKVESVQRLDVREGLPFEGSVFIRQTPSTKPRWANFVEPGISGSLDAVFNASNSAVLMLRVEDRLFAIAFGHGRHLLLPFAYERDFGLRVTLNTVNADRLRSIDTHTFEELTVHTRTQTSRGTPLDTFSVDILKDVLRVITGEPTDPNFAMRLTGADALILTARIAFNDIATKCAEALAAFARDDYKSIFPWIDHLKEVKDPGVIDDLEGLLTNALRSKTLDRLYLAPPEPVDWKRSPTFRYQRDDEDERRSDLDLPEWLDTLKKPDETSVKHLNNNKVFVYYDGSDVPGDSWKLYDTVVFETEMNDLLYVLTAGRWFQVDEGFVAEVATFLKTLPMDTVMLPPADFDQEEKAYNSEFARANPEFTLLDRDEITYGGGHSRIELCDLLSPTNQFIHVKRKTRSATLSHLFSQGTVAADLFLNDSQFRQLAKEKVEGLNANAAGQIPDARPDPREWEVVYAIVTKPSADWPLTLPFFSQLNLMHAAKRLRNQSYRVSTKLIAVQP
jgi:uncharacterized protein (TIGR04141 family)